MFSYSVLEEKDTSLVLKDQLLVSKKTAFAAEHKGKVGRSPILAIASQKLTKSGGHLELRNRV